MAEKILDTTDDCRKELKCIGLRISYVRKLKNVTQAELADKLSNTVTLKQLLGFLKTSTSAK